MFSLFANALHICALAFVCACVPMLDSYSVCLVLFDLSVCFVGDLVCSSTCVVFSFCFTFALNEAEV